MYVDTELYSTLLPEAEDIAEQIMDQYHETLVIYDSTVLIRQGTATNPYIHAIDDNAENDYH